MFSSIPLAHASLVIGILSIILSPILLMVGYWLVLIALALGIFGLVLGLRAKKLSDGSPRIINAGITCSMIGLTGGAVGTLVMVLFALLVTTPVA